MSRWGVRRSCWGFGNEGHFKRVFSIREYEKAYNFFMKDWQGEVIFFHYLTLRLAFILYRLHAFDELAVLVARGEATLRDWIQELKQEGCLEPLDIEYRDEMLEQYGQQVAELNRLQQQQGFIPLFQYEVFATGGCKLYGCARHEHAELGM